MRINELLTESQNLEEGPLLNKIGAAVGKGVGTLAKGVGAVAGGVAGLGSAVKKGFQAGKGTVAQAGDDTEAEPQAAAPAASDSPFAGKVSNPEAPQAAAPAAAAPAPAATPAANPAAEKAGQTLYAQVKASVNQLDKKGKQRIMQLLQKSLAAPAPAAAPAAAPQAAAPVQKTAPARNKPVKVAGKAPAPTAPAVQTAGKINNGNVIAEGFTFFRQK